MIPRFDSRAKCTGAADLSVGSVERPCFSGSASPAAAWWSLRSVSELRLRRPQSRCIDFRARRSDAISVRSARGGAMASCWRVPACAATGAGPRAHCGTNLRLAPGFEGALVAELHAGCPRPAPGPRACREPPLGLPLRRSCIADTPAASRGRSAVLGLRLDHAQIIPAR